MINSKRRTFVTYANGLRLIVVVTATTRRKESKDRSRARPVVLIRSFTAGVASGFTVTAVLTVHL
jgi:hypothetical protein